MGKARVVWRQRNRPPSLTIYKGTGGKGDCVGLRVRSKNLWGTKGRAGSNQRHVGKPCRIRQVAQKISGGSANCCPWRGSSSCGMV